MDDSESPQPTPPSPRTDYSRPVAYDVHGRPLYAHPPTDQPSSQPHHVHFSRAVEPAKPELSDEIRHRHEESKLAFPLLNLSEGEYIITVVRRHPIGLIPAFFVGGLLIALSLTALFFYPEIVDRFDIPNPATIVVTLLLFTFLVGLGVYISYIVYVNNLFILTNESVIQETQTSLFRKNEQTVSLANIEDASFIQHGIIQHIFDYGSIRLSTEGDETTYRFSYVEHPKQRIAVLNNAVEAFKNGRPAPDPTDD